MTASTARAQLRKLRAALADVKAPGCSFGRREQAQLDLHAVLEWLWDTTAGPVLDRVADSRLWWCPVGVMAGLPLHAAGRHRDRAGLTVFDRIVASYTPSLTALADTVHTPPPQHPRPTALVVGVGEREGVPTLPSARDEAEAVAALLPGSTVVMDSAASADAIKDGLHDHAIAHFACHGRAVSSAGHPDLGGLMLDNGMFVPSFVRDLRTTQAQLAFLSACDTASPDPALLDEPLNLAGELSRGGRRGVGAAGDSDHAGSAGLPDRPAFRADPGCGRSSGPARGMSCPAAARRGGDRSGHGRRFADHGGGQPGTPGQ
ncbi:CHAT domain-containing protein [Streptomyces sp. NBC_01615]|uniref:CHAT domain-containing protein n=1 Tax=Streptomyces sp. NBC_01615 TaxID=2975898 RepID=UPI003869FE22